MLQTHHDKPTSRAGSASGRGPAKVSRADSTDRARAPSAVSGVDGPAAVMSMGDGKDARLRDTSGSGQVEGMQSMRGDVNDGHGCGGCDGVDAGGSLSPSGHARATNSIGGVERADVLVNAAALELENLKLKHELEVVKRQQLERELELLRNSQQAQATNSKPTIPPNHDETKGKDAGVSSGSIPDECQEEEEEYDPYADWDDKDAKHSEDSDAEETSDDDQSDGGAPCVRIPHGSRPSPPRPPAPMSTDCDDHKIAEVKLLPCDTPLAMLQVHG